MASRTRAQQSVKCCRISAVTRYTIPTDRVSPFATGGAGLFNRKFVRGALAVCGLPALLCDLPQPVARQRGEATLICVHHAVRLLVISHPTPEVARQRRTPSVSQANT